MNTQQRIRPHVVSTETKLRIIIPARIEIFPLLFLGPFIGLLLAIEYAIIAVFTTRIPPISRADTWLALAFAAGLACFVFPLSREFLLALGGRQEIITLSSNMLRIRFSTLWIIQNKEFAPNEVKALRLAPKEIDLPWSGGYIQFWHRGKEMSLARQVSVSEAEELIRLMYRTGFLPNA